MKAFLILTALCIIGLVVVAFTMADLDPAGISVVVGWAYVLFAYILSLVGLGFLKAVARFRDSRRANPKMDHPGHRMGLVRTAQLPDFMQDGAKTSSSSVPSVPRDQNTNRET